MIISIITVNLNNSSGLQKTVESVRNQTVKNYEFIIIDGKSKDNSLKIIEENKDIIHYFVSELDRGIYDAMNKGLDKATGDFVIFLNSGDILHDKMVLGKVSDVVTTMDAVYFGCAKILQDENNYYLFPHTDSDEDYIKQFLKYYIPCHQAVFFPKKFYKKNKYDTQYSINSDVDYKIRAIKKQGYIFLNIVIVSFALGGYSTTNNFKKTMQIIKESVKIHKVNGEYSILYHIRIVFGVFFKYLLYILFGNDSFKMITKIRKFIK
jgi:putative colanic acid biosynthesis glycosyltransferase